MWRTKLLNYLVSKNTSRSHWLQSSQIDCYGSPANSTKPLTKVGPFCSYSILLFYFIQSVTLIPGKVPKPGGWRSLYNIAIHFKHESRGRIHKTYHDNLRIIYKILKVHNFKKAILSDTLWDRKKFVASFMGTEPRCTRSRTIMILIKPAPMFQNFPGHNKLVCTTLASIYSLV